MKARDAGREMRGVTSILGFGGRESAMLKAGLWVAAALWFMTVSPAWGSTELPQDAEATEPTAVAVPQQLDLPSYSDPQSPLPGAGITSQVFTALGTVLGLLALGVYLYKRIMLRGPRSAQRDETVRVLSRTYLSPKESLCLVQVGTDVLLLGQTSAGITLLHVLPPNASTVASERRDGEEAIDPLRPPEHRRPTSFAQERSVALAGLESRLGRLNRFWESGVSD